MWLNNLQLLNPHYCNVIASFISTVNPTLSVVDNCIVVSIVAYLKFNLNYTTGKGDECLSQNYDEEKVHHAEWGKVNLHTALPTRLLNNSNYKKLISGTALGCVSAYQRNTLPKLKSISF